MRIDRQEIFHLTQNVDPELGRLPTDAELAVRLSCNPKTVGRIRRELGVYRAPLPTVEPVNLPSNDKALMLAMILCGYAVEQVELGKKTFMKIGTESSDPKYKRLMDMEFGGLGEPNNNRLQPGYFLDYKSFKFLMNPLEVLTPESLRSRFRYTPFLFTVIYLRLTPLDRLTFAGVENPDQKQKRIRLLESVNDLYGSLGFRLKNGRAAPLGRFGIRSERGSAFIEVDQSMDVVDHLFRERGVRSLRVFTRDYGQDDVLGDGEKNVFLAEFEKMRADRDRLARTARRLLMEHGDHFRNSFLE